MIQNEFNNLNIFKPKCAFHKHGLNVTSPSTACRNLACPLQSHATVLVNTKQLQSTSARQRRKYHLIPFPRDGFKGKVLSNNSF